MRLLEFKQRGIGLLELMLAIVIIAAILLVATRYYKVSRDNLKVEQAVTMMSEVLKATQQWLAVTPTTQGHIMNTLMAADLLPASYAKNPWGGDFDAVKNTTSLKITLTQLPDAETCKNLSEKMQKYAISSITCKSQQTDPTYVFVGEF